ncbi:tellurite resistance TerB family protein [Geminocystis herdmanii]|uniref:tellurite resistance TerB family protein n=1 Tax=Geminocystis herdmanii TaxID=669359 RepID=UPI00034A3552|nr:TerB family tellurite resistance protein [Geminocystis herdmanii]
MSEKIDFQLPESHSTILQILSAVAWADGDLSQEETEVLIEQFKTDLPVDPEPIAYMEDNMTLYDPFSTNPVVYEQIEARIQAESAFKDILNNYKYNPIPLTDLVSRLSSIEDRCLTVKLAYMVIKASADDEGNLICPDEKAVYRQLVELLELSNDIVTKIELEASQELDKFQHPFKALIHNVTSFFGQKVTLESIKKLAT